MIRSLTDHHMDIAFLLMDVLCHLNPNWPPNVVHSSYEAEYVVISKAGKEVIYLIKLLESFQYTVKSRAIIFSDNEGTISLSKNEKTTSRSKQIDLQVYWIRELI